MKKIVSAILLTTLLLVLLAAPAFALGPRQEQPVTVLEIILSVFLQFASLAGVGTLIAALVNVLKFFKVVTDGNAGKWFAGFNLGAIALLVYFRLFQPQIAVEILDAQAAVLAQILLLILGYVVQLGSGSFAHGLFANLRLPFVGTSFSRARRVASG